MAEPSKKSPKIEELLNTAVGRTSAIESDVCALCGQPATSFRDELSRKEYTIGGMCQSCQDKVFG
jgi:hypothetical protein